MALQFRPLGDRVVLKPRPREETTKAGIVIPDTASEKPQTGEVLAVGSGRSLEDGKRQPLDVNVGDIVLYAKYAGTEFKHDGTEYLIVKESDLLAVMLNER